MESLLPVFNSNCRRKPGVHDSDSCRSPWPSKYILEHVNNYWHPFCGIVFRWVNGIPTFDALFNAEVSLFWQGIILFRVTNNKLLYTIIIIKSRLQHGVPLPFLPSFLSLSLSLSIHLYCLFTPGRSSGLDPVSAQSRCLFWSVNIGAPLCVLWTSLSSWSLLPQ